MPDAIKVTIVGPIQATINFCRPAKIEISDDGTRRLLGGNKSSCFKTVHELLASSFKKHAPLHVKNTLILPNLSFNSHPNFKALGSRTFLGLHQPSFGRGRLPLKIFGDTTWKTYTEVNDDALAFGRGLLSLEIRPLSLESSKDVTENFSQLPRGHTLVIFENTCSDWIIAIAGAMSQSIGHLLSCRSFLPFNITQFIHPSYSSNSCGDFILHSWAQCCW